MRRKTYRNPFASAALSLLVVIFMIFGGETLVAQTHHMNMSVGRTSTKAVDIVRDPADVPPPVGNRAPMTVHVTLATREVVGQLDPSSGTTYRYWTFNGKVPGPMIRVRQGDTVEVTLHNDAGSHMVHSVDFHAALGPGGGAAFSQAVPGQTKTFTFQATTPGLFVYHCGTPMIAEHIANGMYGMILVEPPGGLPHVDHEFYVMQGEIYTAAPKGKTGLQEFSDANLVKEDPQYFVFNGAVEALTKSRAMKADAGQTVRLFFGDAGPNATSSLHVVGEIFTHDYEFGSLTSPPLNGVQTATIPAGGAALLELKMTSSGQFNLMDHAMARMMKGLVATIDVAGQQNLALMHAGPAQSGGGGEATASNSMETGVGHGDMGSEQQSDLTPAVPDKSMTTADRTEAENSAAESVDADLAGAPEVTTPPVPRKPAALPATRLTKLDGCLTVNGLDARLAVLNSGRTYRLQAQPLLFAQNMNRIVHVTGHLGAVAPVSDSAIPTFAVDTVDELAPNCQSKVSPEKLREVEQENGSEPALGGSVAVGMGDMTFTQPEVEIKVGQTVVWKNTSSTVHNVVDDAGKAVSASDVSVPSSAKAFASGYLQPGQVYQHTFTVPGVYRYVCTLHETGGMKATVIVK